MGKPEKKITPEESAKELYKKFWRLTPQPYRIVSADSEDYPDLKFEEWDKDWANKLAKASALKCIEEMILSLEFLIIENMDNDSIMKRLDYLDKVQTELYKI